MSEKPKFESKEKDQEIEVSGFSDILAIEKHWTEEIFSTVREKTYLMEARIELLTYDLYRENPGKFWATAKEVGAILFDIKQLFDNAEKGARLDTRRSIGCPVSRLQLALSYISFVLGDTDSVHFYLREERERYEIEEKYVNDFREAINQRLAQMDEIKRIISAEWKEGGSDAKLNEILRTDKEYLKLVEEADLAEKEFNSSPYQEIMDKISHFPEHLEAEKAKNAVCLPYKDFINREYGKVRYADDSDSGKLYRKFSFIYRQARDKFTKPREESKRIEMRAVDYLTEPARLMKKGGVY